MAVVGTFRDVPSARTAPGQNGHVNGHNYGHSNGTLGTRGAAVHDLHGVNGSAHAATSTNGVARSPVAAAMIAPAPDAPRVPAAEELLLPMRSLTRIFTVRTERHSEFADITAEVQRCLAESSVTTGFAVVFSRHTTAGIRINEHEPLLLEDMAKLLDTLVPQGASYQHDDFTVRTVNLTENERVNGHSHCRSLLLGASETIPVAAGQLLLGSWQRIFLVELDGPNQREFVVQIVGA